MRCFAPGGSALVAVLIATGCGKAPAPSPSLPALDDKAVTVVAPTAEAVAALPAAVSPSAAATAVAAPADATVSELDAPYQPTPQALASASVAIFIDAGAKNPPGSPTAGQLTTVTVTPVDGNGRPLRTRESLFGAELVMVALRHDLSWVETLRATQLSEPGGLSHRFALKFPKPGRHLLYFLVKPAGGPVSATPVDLTVRGDAEPAVAWGEDKRQVTGPDGLAVELRSAPEQFEACRPSHIATSWLQKGKPMALHAAETQRVLYLAIPESAGQASVGKPLQIAGAPSAEAPTPTDRAQDAAAAVMSVQAIGGDAGSDAWLTLHRPGRYRILALAQAASGKGASKASPIRSAAFAVTAGGTAPAGGCP